MEMPEMDGLTATRQIRQKLTIQPQIVAMTANVLAEDYYTCLDSGIDDYITKPIKINEMIRILHSQPCPF
jgi:CheY-like chemotaxis protein